MTHLIFTISPTKNSARDSGEQPLQHGDAIALATVDAVWKPGSDGRSDREVTWVTGSGRDVFQHQIHW